MNLHLSMNYTTCDITCTCVLYNVQYMVVILYMHLAVILYMHLAVILYMYYVLIFKLVDTPTHVLV